VTHPSSCSTLRFLRSDVPIIFGDGDTGEHSREHRRGFDVDGVPDEIARHFTSVPVRVPFGTEVSRVLCPCCSAKVCHVPCRSSHRRIYPLSSLSTAAYHASAVTLDAGLGPDRGDDTQSGAELDPERPLQNIMAEAERLSMFGNNTTSKSIHNVSF
jgi:hypothetical protein